MAATVVSGASASGSYASLASPSVTIAGYVPQEDDQVWVLVGVTNTATSGAGDADWLEVPPGMYSASDSSMAAVLVVHVVTAAEALAGTNSWTLTDLFSGAETGQWFAVATRGGNTTPDATARTSDEAAGSTAAPLPGLPGADLGTDSLVLYFIVSDFPSRVFTTPGGTTQILGGAIGGWVGHRNTLTTAGADVAATTITINTADETISYAVAIAPAGGAPGTVSDHSAWIVNLTILDPKAV